MKIDVSCAWGDGPDVAMNLHPSKKEQEGIRQFGDDLIPVDLTAKEAKELSSKLFMAAMQAELSEQDASCHFEHKEPKE